MVTVMIHEHYAIKQCELKKILHYDPVNGVFTWIVGNKYSKKPKAGDVAGCKSKGYINISIKGIGYRAHRLAWLYIHGEWPSGVIDHINGNRSDNSISNLRDVTTKENNKNKRTQKNNKSGVTGVFWSGSAKKWSATIGHKGRVIYLGVFDSIEKAIKARTLAESKYRFHSNHGRVNSVS